MPVQIFNKNYTDIFSNSLSYYKTNVGDPISLDLTLHASIRMSSSGNSFFLDGSINYITSGSQSWINEGFRIGDSITLTIYDSGGTQITTWNATILYVDDTVINPNTILAWFNTSLGEFITITVTGRARATLEILLNHCLNTSSGLPASLIDGESTRARFENTDGMAVGDIISGIILVNQSGQFLKECTIERLANYATGIFAYTLNIQYINSGVYDASSFATSNCLKTYLKMEWASLDGEPFAKTVSVLNESGDTGYFDQPYNTGVVDAVLIQGVNEIDYAVATTFDVIIDSASTDFAIGSLYQSTDTAYFKNRPYSQSELSMIIESTIPTIGVGYLSYINENLAQYQLELNSITTVGTVNTLNITFTPSIFFTAFMDSLEAGDRLMKLWVKFGNLNLLVFDSQLTKSPPVGGALIPEQNIFIDHSDNTNDSIDTALGYEANSEDDLAFCGKFLLEKGAIYESINYKIEAFNTSTLESFDLNNCFFNISTVPQVGGIYILNQTQTVQNTLPTTSEKRVASLVLEPSIDTPTEYGIKVYFPFLLRWEYWLQQLNADADFYPNNQTKNWFEYNNLGDWQLRLNIELIKDGLAYIFTDVVTDKGYDSSADIDQTIELYIDSSNTNVGIVTEGQLMRVIGTHTLVNGFVWDDATVWGQITVEPTESNPRFISSTVIDYDNNPSNPLIPLVGEVGCKLTFPTTTQAKLECYFNPDLINLTNGVKFTTKIKGCQIESPVFKVMTTDLQKLTTPDENKIIS
jgi:hypothetical protein